MVVVEWTPASHPSKWLRAIRHQERRPKKWLLVAWIALSCGSLWSRTARARSYSSYEQRTLELALGRVGGEIDPEPDGKRIEGVRVVRLDVVDERDPFPPLVNAFHATTRGYVVERELLLTTGQPFEQRLSDETERNLRGLFLFSVVIAVPLRGEQPGTVRYLVVTKDLWSLRAGWDGRYANGVLDYLSVKPSETNLLGTGRQLSVELVANPRTVGVGLGYVEPRLVGTRLRLAANVLTTINCVSGRAEGYVGSFSYSRPLFSTRTRWAYATVASVSRGIARLSGALGQPICGADNSSEVARPVRPELPFDDPEQRFALVPNEYDFDGQSFTQSFTRSFGYARKVDLSFGLEARRTGRVARSLANVRPDPTTRAPLTRRELEIARSWYLRRVRATEGRIGPFFQILSYENRWQRTLDLETLGLQEDVRLGPVARLRLYPAHRDLGSTRSIVGLQALASHASRLGSGYVKVEGTHDVELGRADETHATVGLGFRLASPRLAAGRLIVDATFSNVYRNYHGSFLSLDNRSRLRGYRADPRSNDLYGSGLVAGNLEFRSRPLSVFSTLIGAVAFYDVGDAFYELEEIRLRHGFGVGVRFLIPQLDREVLRIDVGFPADRSDPLGEITVNASFRQAFSPP